ncbi:hypothetical protein ACE1BS_15860 [Aeromonas jandaei]
MPPADLHNAVNTLSRKQSQLAEAFEAANLKRANDEAKKNLQAMKEIYAVMTSSVTNYTNIIIAAGYAGLLSLLSSLSVKMQPLYLYIVGFFLVLSLASFISFEIFKMISMTNHVNAVMKHLESGRMQPVDALNMIKSDSENFNLNNLNVWRYSLIFTIATAVICALVLLYALAAHIYSSASIV